MIVVLTSTGLPGVSSQVNSGQSFSNWITTARLDDPTAPVARSAASAHTTTVASTRSFISILLFADITHHRRRLAVPPKRGNPQGLTVVRSSSQVPTRDSVLSSWFTTHTPPSPAAMS